MPTVGDGYPASPPSELLEALQSSQFGLSSAEARRRLDEFGPNLVERRQHDSDWRLLGRQIASPLVLLLVFATGVSLFAGGLTEAALVGFIVVTGVGIGFWCERGERGALEKLAGWLVLKARILRNGVEQPVPASDVVPGDVVLLNAGSIVPADAMLLEANDFFTSEATLTGESFPVAKRVGPSDPGAPLGRRTGCVFMGTNARSGSARALVVRTGRQTAFGAIAHRLAEARPETEFERGLKRFGYLLTIAMLAITLCVFAANVLFGRGPADSLLFSLALAVGLAPELLPTILSINLAHAAGAMAGRGVLVRRLDAIETPGSMDLLCTDKTGTLTVGAPQWHEAIDPDGAPSPAVLEAAAANAHLQAGLLSPLDECLAAALPAAPAPAANRHPGVTAARALRVAIRGSVGGQSDGRREPDRVRARHRDTAGWVPNSARGLTRVRDERPEARGRTNRAASNRRARRAASIRPQPTRLRRSAGNGSTAGQAAGRGRGLPMPPRRESSPCP